MEQLRKRVVRFTNNDDDDFEPVFLNEQDQDAFVEQLRLTNNRDNRMFSIIFSFLYLLLIVPLFLYPEYWAFKLVELLSLFYCAYVMYFLPLEVGLFNPQTPNKWKFLFILNIGVTALITVLGWSQHTSFFYAFLNIRTLVCGITIFTEIARYSMYHSTLSVEKLDEMRFAHM